MCSDESENLMRNWEGEERRKYPRYTFSSDVLLKLKDDTEKSPIQYQGHCQNISLRGLYIEISLKHFYIKENIKLQIKIPVSGTSHDLELIGQVTWSSQDENGSKVGIQFLPNDNRGKEVFLFQFVEGVKKKA